MPSKRHKKITDLFRAACELRPEARAAFLEEACAGDTKLRAEVEALLAHDEQHPSFLETPQTLEAPSNPGHKTRTGKSPAAAAIADRVIQEVGALWFRVGERLGE